MGVCHVPNHPVPAPIFVRWDVTLGRFGTNDLGVPNRPTYLSQTVPNRPKPSKSICPKPSQTDPNRPKLSQTVPKVSVRNRPKLSQRTKIGAGTGPFGTVWDRLGRFGTVWDGLGRFGTFVWGGLGQFGTVWDICLGRFGTVWDGLGHLSQTVPSVPNRPKPSRCHLPAHENWHWDGTVWDVTPPR